LSPRADDGEDHLRIGAVVTGLQLALLPYLTGRQRVGREMRIGTDSVTSAFTAFHARLHFEGIARIVTLYSHQRRL
jgi:hypothetical protein